MNRNEFWAMLLVIIAWELGACKKEQAISVPVASLKLVNVVAGGSMVFLGNSLTPVFNMGSDDFTLKPEEPYIYIWPEGDSLHPYYRVDKPFDIVDRDIFTIFLGGTQTAPEGILVKESLPQHTDSMAGVRFVHLAPGAPAVNVTLSEFPVVKEFSNINYRGITEFKDIPARMANASYTFQIRDAVSDSVLVQISMSGTNARRAVPRFRNVTLVFQGQAAGPSGLGITRVNHY